MLKPYGLRVGPACPILEKRTALITLFSDLHGNDSALRLLLEQTAGRVISVGDVLGRAGSNMACLSLLRERGIPSVQGNHELRMLDSIYRPTIEDWAADWIRQWPMELIDDEALVIHTLLEYSQHGVDFHYIDRPEQAQELLQKRPRVFTGHLHMPGYWRWDEKSLPAWTTVRAPLTVELDPAYRYLFQVGSLGEPVAEHLPRYVVWSDERVEWRRLERTAE